MESQRDYLNRRALEEEEAAARATSEKVRELHEEMASRYRDAAGTKGEISGSSTNRNFNRFDPGRKASQRRVHISLKLLNSTAILFTFERGQE